MPRLRQAAAMRGGAVSQRQHEARNAGVVAQFLVTILERRPHGLDFHWIAPIRRRGDRTVIGAEADRVTGVAVFLAAELADIEFAARRPMRHDKPHATTVGRAVAQR